MSTQKHSQHALSWHKHGLISASILAVFIVLAPTTKEVFHTYAAVSSSVSMRRQCFDSDQKALSAADTDAITQGYYRTGHWVFVDDGTNRINEKPKIGEKGTLHWRSRSDATPEADVFCAIGFCQYGKQYCTFQPPSAKYEKEMRCYQSVLLNARYFDWSYPQAMPTIPTDIGEATLEPDLKCNELGIGPAEWAYIEEPKDVPAPAPTLEADPSSVSASLLENTPQIPLIQLLRESKRR